MNTIKQGDTIKTQYGQIETVREIWDNVIYTYEGGNNARHISNVEKVNGR